MSAIVQPIQWQASDFANPAMAAMKLNTYNTILQHLAQQINDKSSGSSVNLSLYALINSPTFTGIPAAPTAAAGTNSTQIATTAFVAAALAGVVGTPGPAGPAGAAGAAGA